MSFSLQKYRGAMLGLALGDAMGAPLEGGPLERLVWRLLGLGQRDCLRWTDDTQMSVDLARSLIAGRGLDLQDLAERFAGSYRWTRGYGPGAAKLLKRIRRGQRWQDANVAIYPTGSFGNGGAMRAPVIGLAYGQDLGRVPQAAADSAQITHAHPLGMEGAVLIALATAHALRDTPSEPALAELKAACSQPAMLERLDQTQVWLGERAQPDPAEVARTLGHGIIAAESCVTAVYLAHRHLQAPFEELQAFVHACGGDVDTIGAMAGAIWGAARGADALPKDELARLEDCAGIDDLAKQLHALVDASPVFDSARARRLESVE